MGITERKERDKEVLRQKIMDAAAELILEEGIEKCTIRKVAEKIEYSPRIVYLYFNDKDHLLHEIIEQGFEITLGQMAQMRKEIDYSNPRELISFQLRNNIMNALSAPNFYKAIIYLLHFKNYQAGPNQMKVVLGVREDLTKSYESLGLPLENLEEKSDFLFSFMRGFNLALLNKELKPGKPETEQYIQMAITAMIDGILKLP